MTIRAIVVDDEPTARHSILRCLQVHPGVQVQAECGDGVSAVIAIKQHAPDVVFLETRISGLSGLELLSKVGPKQMPLTVFVTAHAEYAVKAFEARAVDYLLKPFGQRRFDEALSRVEEKLAAQTPSRKPVKRDRVEESESKYLEWIPVSDKGRVRPVRVADIDWMEAEKNHVLLHVGRRLAVVRRTLNSLEESLDPRQFARIHRSTLVNAERIHEIHCWRNGYHMVVLKSGQHLRMSRYQQRSARMLLGSGK
jgi:two-component system, LytTR family, response regulator